MGELEVILTKELPKEFFSVSLIVEVLTDILYHWSITYVCFILLIKLFYLLFSYFFPFLRCSYCVSSFVFCFIFIFVLLSLLTWYSKSDYRKKAFILSRFFSCKLIQRSHQLSVIKYPLILRVKLSLQTSINGFYHSDN